MREALGVKNDGQFRLPIPRDAIFVGLDTAACGIGCAKQKWAAAGPTLFGWNSSIALLFVACEA